ncbi:Uncharacterised protein [Escherichia coli]|nr:Uncharacterised protein [Escherichia coli]SQP06671.1 Uncharacterised protein [Escherichia coli]SQP07929.1 Uncharacterised protein [Escherichia coli]SQT06027.1 Uncharacterised protein [Escherichia coli]SRZ41597.1 Uncharacterised protein [Escherichia coli]
MKHPFIFFTHSDFSLFSCKCISFYTSRLACFYTSIINVGNSKIWRVRDFSWSMGGAGIWFLYWLNSRKSNK